MIYQEGYVYHIKDEYFEKVRDSNLMQNKEGGTYRPTFYCLRDNKTSLLWMVPLRDYYLDHIDTRNNNPVPVKHSIHREVTTRMKKIRQLHSRGKKVVFPDIDRLEQIMLAEVKDNAAE